MAMLFIFGQAEKGALCRPTLCKHPIDLIQQFGHPPKETFGLYLAIQTVLLKTPCIYFRVEEEGFSYRDYFRGLDILKSDWEGVPIQAIGLPGVGNMEIIEKTERLFLKKRSLILITEKDLFDFLTG